ncbi:MAG: sigma 54-interacting transcriptional regulator [Desulfamplus sp.]|nr:sigma 54-interacting transcriptional regulator [Desulfamplus sp.]
MFNPEPVLNEKAIDENEFCRQAIFRMSSSLNINTVMESCMVYIKQYIPMNGIHFCVYEKGLKRFHLLVSVWHSDLPKPKKSMPVHEKFWESIDITIKASPTVKIYDNRNTYGALLPYAKEIRDAIWPKQGSFIVMDLEMDKKRLGMLILYSEEDNIYNKEHTRLISMLHDQFSILLANVLRYNELIRLKEMLIDDNRYLYQQMRNISGDSIIGAEFGLKGVMEMVYNIASLNSPVLLMGETGVGKEVVANAIHYSSQRKNEPFIKINCGAIPESLMESELFGHDKGSFTGALFKKRGRFERANKGTIFLDELGELPLTAQIKLLRVVQHQEIERVGGTEVIPVDVRIISATSKNLEEMIKRGTFREDLWFRLNVFPVIIPPLRQRGDDIHALVSHFIEKKCRELKIDIIPTLTQDALQNLRSYTWPGNVRELENVIERAMIRYRMGERSDELIFDFFDTSKTKEKILRDREEDYTFHTLNEMNRRHILKALELSDGKVEGKKGAAELLGINPHTLRGRMRKLNIPFGKCTFHLGSEGTLF